MQKFLKYIFILIFTLILQVTIFSYYPVNGIKPDLLLVVVVISSLISGSSMGIKTGFGAGTLQDVFLGGIFGKYTISKILIGSISGIFSGKIYKKNYIFPPLLIFGVTLIQENLIILLSKKILFNINYLETLGNIILFEAIYNGLLGLLLYPIFLKIFRIGDRKSWTID